MGVSLLEFPTMGMARLQEQKKIRSISPLLKRSIGALILLLLASCSTTPLSPNRDFSKHEPPSQELNLKAALIVTDDLKNLEHQADVYAPCIERIEKGIVRTQTGCMRAKSSIGKEWEKELLKGASSLFRKVDLYGNTTEIKHREDYDCILVPDVTVRTSYDERKASGRKLEQVFLPFKIWYTKRDPIPIGASVECRLQVEDVKDGDTATFVGEGASESSTMAETCLEFSERSFGLDHTWTLSRDYSKVIGEAMNKAFKELMRETETGLLLLAQAKAERLALPCGLSLTVRFSDSDAFFPNSILDAGEDVEVTVTIENNGKGAGYGTVLEVTSDSPAIAFERDIKIGDIPLNGTKEVKLHLKAGLGLETGKASLGFNLKEKRGYDAKRVVMYLPTAKLEKPRLEVTSTEINDAETGLAKGNGNGIPETGETIELTAFVSNQGPGRAIGVQLVGEKIASGIQWVRDSTPVGVIQPGEVAKAKLAFTIPRDFEAKEIVANLKATDSRGVSQAEKKVTMAFAKRFPDLQYAYRILSARGTPISSITNGEEYEIEFKVSNKGHIPAREVAVLLSSPGGVTLSRSRIDLGEVKEQDSTPGHKVRLTIPRTFTNPQVALQIEIAQSDFSSLKSSLQIPVEVKSPRLSYEATPLSRNGGNTMEQGEAATLEVRVLNEGNLTAEGVKIKIESRDENLKILGKDEALIGKIPANSKTDTIKFELSATRRIKVGDAHLSLNITQSDFPSVASEYAINIREEALTVVDLSAEERIKGPTSSTAPRGQLGSPSGPAIHLKAPQPAEMTDGENIRLAFEVVDKRNIEMVKVEVNGISLPLDEKAGLLLRASKKADIMTYVPLKEGENKIVIVAYNADNLSARKEFSVSRAPEEDVDSPPVTRMRNPDGVAVVIGISKFRNRDIPNVDYARRDAMAVREYLIKTLGFDEKKIIEACDENALLSDFKSIFGRRLKNMVNPGKSDVFVFYSGHGVPDTNSKEALFVPYDFDPYSIADTGYPLRECYKRMEDLGARSVTIVIDACFSGSSERGLVIQGMSPAFLEVTNPMLRIRSGVVFASSAAKQISSWYHKKQHGLFTYYFLKGLRGRADVDNDGQVTARELEEFLSRNVAEQARILYNREQTPEVAGNKDAVLVRFR